MADLGKETTKMIEELRDTMDKDIESILKSEDHGVLDKTKGSEHYKSKGLQPFDIYEILPCQGFTPFMIFCSFNILKYIWRICNGSKYVDKDIEKIIHYAETLKTLRDNIKKYEQFRGTNETQKENNEA